MDLNKIKARETRVTIAAKFKKNATTGMFVGERNMNARMPGVNGVVVDFVPGHGGDIWFVAHSMTQDNQSYTNIGAYSSREFMEFNVKENPESAALDNREFLNKYGVKPV